MFLPSLPTLCSNFAIVRLYLISIKSAIHWMLLSHNLVSLQCIPNSISVFIRLWQFLGSVYVIWILIWTGLNCLILLTSLEGMWVVRTDICFLVLGPSRTCFCAYLFVLWCAHLFVNFWLGQDWISWEQSASTCKKWNPVFSSVFLLHVCAKYRVHIYFSNRELYTWIQIFICLQFTVALCSRSA